MPLNDQHDGEVNSAEATIDLRIAAIQDEVKKEAKALGKLASALGPLAKIETYENLEKLPALIERIEKKIATSPRLAERGAAAIAMARQELGERYRRMREELARELRALCEKRGLPLRIVRNEEPIELRIPPFAVVIDRKKGKAELQFGKCCIKSCAAEATVILEAYDKALKEMEAGFDAPKLFDACKKAWLAARSAEDAGAGDRVEIIDFLPYLALQMQKPSFKVEPSSKNYRGYGRARFAYDMDHLRRSGNLERNGWRLQLGVATGTTATKKKRVVWCEDGRGDGEYKLTVFFTQAGGGR